MQAAPEAVHIQPAAPRQSARQVDHRRLAQPADPAALPAAVLDLPASLEYASGCQSSPTRVLGAAVRQPFSVASAARELPGGGVAVQCTLASNLAVPARLSRVVSWGVVDWSCAGSRRQAQARRGSDAGLLRFGQIQTLLCLSPAHLQALEPQAGFAVSSSLLEGLGLLPTTLPPFGSLTAAFLLSPDVPSGPDHAVLPAKLAPSALVVEYSVDSRQQCGVAVAALGPVGAAGRGGSPTAAAAAAGAAAGLQQTPAAEVLDLLPTGSNSGPAPGKAAAAGGSSDGGSPTSTAGGEAGGGHRQHCCFRHRMTLEMPAPDSTTSGEFCSGEWCWRLLPCSTPPVLFVLLGCV